MHLIFCLIGSFLIVIGVGDPKLDLFDFFFGWMVVFLGTTFIACAKKG